MKRPDGQTIFLGLAAVMAAVAIGVFVAGSRNGQAGAPTRQKLTLESIPFDGKAAYEMLHQVCDIGPRKSGSAGMKQQQEMLAKHFRALGGEVEMQTFVGRDPLDGSDVPMANLIARWYRDRSDRILLCAHYDTRPFPDRDPDPAKRKAAFIGANDGGSGVAVLAELARHLKNFDSRYGVDIVLFDGEEYVYDDTHPYFLGSQHFAEQYVIQEKAYQYRWGVLLDMVGDADLQLLQEVHGLRWADTRPLINSIWRVARRLGVREFVRRPGLEIRDDHLPLHNVGKIPCCDIIDFHYPRPGVRSYWHTTEDTADKCSALSLAKVGWVVLEWLQQLD